MEKNVLYVALAMAIAGLVFTFYTIIGPFEKGQMSMPQADNLPKKTAMSFTAFDAAMARQFMDKNNDGLCDICGMRIEDCIKSGMLQCTMDPNAKIGLLGSSHIHADFKVFIEGKTIDFAKPEEVSELSIYWFDDTGVGECRVPTSWKVFYKEGEKWPAVYTVDKYGVEKDKYNSVIFETVRTQSIKIEIQSQKDFAGGIHEIKLK